jgi:hypothetical protein
MPPQCRECKQLQRTRVAVTRMRCRTIGGSKVCSRCCQKASITGLQLPAGSTFHHVYHHYAAISNHGIVSIPTQGRRKRVLE